MTAERGTKRIPWLWVGITGAALAAAAVAALVVPRAPESIVTPLSGGVDAGPDSYFKHFYDPGHLVENIGSIDLELDNLQSFHTHSVLVAVFPSLPGNDPDFTMRVAEKWRPGARTGDNGLIVFLFMAERRIRVEVGYGLEAVLPDVEVRRWLQATMVPAFERGDVLGGLEAGMKALVAKLEAVPPGTPQGGVSFLTGWLFFIGRLPRLAALAGQLWLVGPFGLRMLIAMGVIALAGIAVHLGVHLVRMGRALARWRTARASEAGVRTETTELLGALVGLGKGMLILFILTTTGEYFWPGSGRFGGGGVDVTWRAPQ